MADTDKLFAGSIPDIYDDYLVPLIFEDFAVDMAARVAALDPGTVLETAAGSGVVTRALAPRLASATRYVVTDLNQPMLDRARRKQPGAEALDWHQADALDLPFEDEGFDVVCCQFGVMFFPDKVAGYRAAHRVLRPGGSLIFNVWDRIEENHFAHCVTGTVSRLYPDDPPLFLARTPHGYHDAATIEDQLRAAGFARIAIDTIAVESVAADPRHPSIAYCQGTPLRNELEARGTLTLDAVTEAAAQDLEERFGTGRIAGRVITAVR